jgi:hypothetical protein
MAKKLTYTDDTNKAQFLGDLRKTDVNDAIDKAAISSGSKDWIGRNGFMKADVSLATQTVDGVFTPNLGFDHSIFYDGLYSTSARIDNPSVQYNYQVMCYGNWFLKFIDGAKVTPLKMRWTIYFRLYDDNDVLQDETKLARDWMLDDGAGNRYNSFYHGSGLPYDQGVEKQQTFQRTALLAPLWYAKFDIEIVGLSGSGIQFSLDGYMEFKELNKWEE